VARSILFRKNFIQEKFFRINSLAEESNIVRGVLSGRVLALSRFFPYHLMFVN
jgi:hypothetical protein